MEASLNLEFTFRASRFPKTSPQCAQRCGRLSRAFAHLAWTGRWLRVRVCVCARASGAREGGEEGATHATHARHARATRARTRRSPDAHGATRVQHRQTHVRAATRMLRVAWVRQTHAELGRDSKLAQAHARPERALRVGEKDTRARTLFAQAALHAHAPPGLFSREAAASLRSLTLALSHCVGVSLQGREATHPPISPICRTPLFPYLTFYSFFLRQARRVVRWRLDHPPCHVD